MIDDENNQPDTSELQKVEQDSPPPPLGVVKPTIIEGEEVSQTEEPAVEVDQAVTDNEQSLTQSQPTLEQAAAISAATSIVIRDRFYQKSPLFEAVNRKLIPKLFITDSALTEMHAEVLDYPDIETAWALFGLIAADCSEVIVNLVVRPNNSKDVTRLYGNAILGGQRLYDVTRWVIENHKYRVRSVPELERYRADHLFKGHSHHKLGIEGYSGQDIRSIIEAVTVDGLEVAVGPLANIKKSVPLLSKDSGNTIAIDFNSKVRIKFYYHSRHLIQAGVQSPMVLNPIIVPDKEVPQVAPLLWDFTQQVKALRSCGCEVEVLYAPIKGKVPLQILFKVKKPNWNWALTLITEFDFPNEGIKGYLEPITDPAELEKEQEVDAAFPQRYATKFIPPESNPEITLLEHVLRLEWSGILNAAI